jgi:exosortase
LEKCKALILVGEPDFGRCPLASRMHRAFWPFGGKPVLLRLVEYLAAQGIRRIDICSSEKNRGELESLRFSEDVSVQIRLERLLRGTAGNIRDVLASEPADTVLLVFNGAMLNPPPLSRLLEEHRKKGGKLTIFFQPTDGRTELLEDAEIYLCQSELVPLIPSEGYFDLKENLVPALVKEGFPIFSSILEYPSGTFRTWRDYRDAVGELLRSLETKNIDLSGVLKCSEEPIWIGKNVQIDPTVTLLGPIWIGENTVIQEGCFLFGPLMIESGVWIGPHSTLSASVVGPQATMGSGSFIDRCVIAKGAVISSCTEVSDKLIHSAEGKAAAAAESWKRRLIRREDSRQAQRLASLLGRPHGGLAALLLFALTASVFIGVYWNPTLVELWRIWMRSDEYSSGILVPLLAVYLIWDRKKTLLSCPIRPSLPAVFVLLFVQVLRLAALGIGSGTLDRFSFFLTIGALVWMILGWEFYKRIFTLWLYLYLMLPLPKIVEWTITVPLQKWATISAVFCLETLGFNVIREGNIININGTLVAVAEACNGLRMLTAFFVVSGFIVLICRRSLWEKGLIFISSVPIALLCNTIRLVLTSIAFLFLEGQDWEKIFHDYGGLVMMPLAIVLTLLELKFFSKLFIQDEQRVPLMIQRSGKKEL